MVISRNAQNNTAVEIRDSDEHEFDILQLWRPTQVLVTVVNTLDKEMTIKLKGALFNDPAMANPTVDTQETIAIGSGTTQVISIQSDAKWQYVQVTAKAATNPTVGSLKVVINAPQE